MPSKPLPLRLDSDLADARISEASPEPGAGHVVEVTIIRAGTSTNNNHYPENLLREIAPLFEGARAFADHSPSAKAAQPRSVRDLVGHYSNAHFEMTPQGGRVRADLHILPGQDWLWGLVQESQNHPGLAGLSIDALGECKMAEVGGKRVRMVEAIRKINSVDLVSKPAAGGSLDRLIAGDEDDPQPPSNPESTQTTSDLEEDTDLAEPGIADERPAMVDQSTQDQLDEAASELSAEDRKKYAVIARKNPDGSTDYKFPIPPGDKAHALAALRLLNTSDLTDDEKAKVKARAEQVLGAQPQPETKPSPTKEAHQVSTEPNQETPITESHLDLGAELKKLQAERDAAARELAQIREALAPAPAQPADPNASAVQLLEQIKRDRDLEKSARVLDSELLNSKLPQAIQNRLRKRYDGRVFTPSQLQEEIDEEREILGALSSSGQVTGHGYEKTLHVGRSEYEQLQAAFDKMFGIAESDEAKSVPGFAGVREAFAVATGRDISSIGGCDLPLRESFQASLATYVRAKMENGQLSEAEYLLRETDVTTSSFSYLLGTSMNKRLLKDYQAWPSEWQKFANVVAVKDFKLQDRIRLGAFGSLSTVAEDAAYTTLTLSDTHATYTPTKRGNLVQISRETIINDDLYAIKQIPQKLAVAAAYTLAEFVYGLLDPGAGNIYDSHPLFDSVNHLNTGVTSANLSTPNSGTALSSAAMQTAVIAMRKQKNAASKPIGLKPRFLLVCPDLEFTAMTILKSAGLPGGANNDINPMMGYAEPIVAPQLNNLSGDASSTTIAMVVADPRVVDTVELGFIGGQVNPVLFIQDQPLYGINFTQDVISYKVRHEYGGAVVDYRGFYLINN